jgi:N-acylneuraminate cytidylyltransferase
MNAPLKQIAFIFARGGSKGIRDKNTQPAGGKPLIAHAISCALESQHIARVIVSTDSKKIASVAQSCGAEILMRPSALATDISAEILAWRHAIETYADHFKQPGTVFISLPATSPLRICKNIDDAIARHANKDCDIVFGITPSHRNPYLNMATINDADHIELVIKGKNAVRRQDVPPVYDITTCIYVASASYIQQCNSLMDGRVGYVKIAAEHALDIDTPFDLYLADLMLTHPFKPQH